MDAAGKYTNTFEFFFVKLTHNLFVYVLAAYNCKLMSRSPDKVVVNLPTEGIVEFQVLHVLPFDSNRKRMSILVKHPISREIILYCKGADSAIMERLVDTDDPEELTVREKTNQNLSTYAKQGKILMNFFREIDTQSACFMYMLIFLNFSLGLRTLVMAKRVISKPDYNIWLEKHIAAENSIRGRESLLEDSFDRIEREMTLIGASGIGMLFIYTKKQKA